MTNISNIDAILDLIMREARARKGHSLKTRVYNVKNEVDRRLGFVMSEYEHDERSKAKVKREAEWAKGM